MYSSLHLRRQVVALRLSERWRPLSGGRNLMSLLVDGARFEDGILTELPVSAEEAVAAWCAKSHGRHSHNY